MLNPTLTAIETSKSIRRNSERRCKRKLKRRKGRHKALKRSSSELLFFSLYFLLLTLYLTDDCYFVQHTQYSQYGIHIPNRRCRGSRKNVFVRRDADPFRPARKEE